MAAATGRNHVCPTGFCPGLSGAYGHGHPRQVHRQVHLSFITCPSPGPMEFTNLTQGSRRRHRHVTVVLTKKKTWNRQKCP